MNSTMMQKVLIDNKDLSPDEINSHMKNVWQELLRTPNKIAELMQVTSMKTGPLAYLWLANAALASEKIKGEDQVFELMNSILKDLKKDTEHLWYSKIGDLCNQFVKWCSQNNKQKKGLTLIKKILTIVQDSPDQFTNVHQSYAALCFNTKCH